MKHLITFSMACLLLAGTLSAQDDTRSRAILDRLVANSKSWTSFKADFTSRLVSKRDKLDVEQQGTVLVRGDRFRLELEDNTIINDGKSIWTYSPSMNEVTVSDPAELGEMDPSTIFTMYEKGFKSEFVEERKSPAGGVVQVIKLYPLDAAEKPYHTVVMEVDKAKVEPRMVTLLYKDGNEVSYSVRNFVPNAPTEDASFQFNAARHPGVEVNDMR